MSKLDSDHRCFGKPSEILVCKMMKGFGKHKVWGVWVSDGANIYEACTVADHDTYYKAFLPAIIVAFKMQNMKLLKDWPIALYYGADGFANHNRYVITEENDIIQHILANV
jgi:hypothetical protein